MKARKSPTKLVLMFAGTGLYLKKADKVGGGFILTSERQKAWKCKQLKTAETLRDWLGEAFYISEA